MNLWILFEIRWRERRNFKKNGVTPRGITSIASLAGGDRNEDACRRGVGFSMDGQTKNATRRAFGWVITLLVFLFSFSPIATSMMRFPENINITQGYAAQLNLPGALSLEVNEEEEAKLAISDLSESIADMDKTVTIEGNEVGNTSMILKMLGIPVKKVNVNINPEKRLMPGGQSVGIAIRTEGVLVVGSSDIGTSPSPARLAGLKSGDMIECINGTPVESTRHLSELLTSDEAMEVSVRRNDRLISMSLQPIKDERDGKYRIGAWVRDSTAGVGTLSFYDMETGYFGALGHAITDIDTGTVLSIGDGGLYESEIIGITKGESGSPGELIGEFASNAHRIGDILENGDFGIYGEMYSLIYNPLYSNGLPIATHDEVRLGEATILTTLDGDVKEYTCEIEKLYPQDSAKQRGMVVKITDPELLNMTGGIVQGMSGSPIIQDGRIIGVVTHVFVNDPTHGYGMYIEWMLDQLEEAEDPAA